MASEIKVDTISEQTSANGVTIDGLTIKDGNIIGDVALAGTTPTFTIGDGGAEDAALIFDGNAVDYYIALDDSADNLIIGSGSTVGSNSLITIDSDGDTTFDIVGGITLDADDEGTISFKDGGSRYGLVKKASDNFEIQSMLSDGDIVFKGNDGGATITALTLDMSDAGTATFNHDVKLGDNSKALFGAGDDLEIYHDGSNSYVKDAGTGNLRLEGTDIRVANSGGTGDYIRCTNGGATDLLHNGSVKISTASGGVDVTGTVTSDGASLDGAVVINESSADVDFRVESNGNANMLFVDGGNDKIGIGHNNPSQLFSVKKDQNTDTAIRIANATAGDAARASLFMDVDAGGAQLMALSASFSTSGAYIADNVTFVADTAMSNGMTIGTRSSDAGAHIRFFTQDSESARIEGGGTVLVGKTSSGLANAGVELATDKLSATVSAATIMYLNRLTNDGTIAQFHQAGTEEGSIEVSGSTVSYNGFTGSHWSRLADNSKPTILRGTIMESIDEMCDWYQAVAEVAESTDDEGNVTPAHTVKEPIALGDKSVGDAITFTSDGTEYTGTIVKEDDVKHTKSKVSDTADSKKVYGVFSNWDDADDGLDGDVNDMNIAQVGTFIIRVHKDVTVEAGDLLVSNGDGTAKVQDDDIIRSKTVAKVNSNIKVETYSDGSYTVPCTLHC
jgi:hypothetical protein